MRSVLVVDDDHGMRSTLSELFEQEGFAVCTAERVREAVEKAEEKLHDIAIIDLRMGEEDGLDVLKAVKRANPNALVIVLTGYGSIDSAVEAMKLGASDYLTKPVDLAKLLQRIRTAQEQISLQKTVKHSPHQVQEQHDPIGFVVSNPKMRQVIDRALQVAGTNATVLIQGESGTGKEVLARAIHMWSPRADHPFIAIDCATLPEPLLESELFGHMKGAFTGAIVTKKGLFEEGDGGTIFLDELEAMPLSTQVKLLRVLQDQVIRRVGGTKPVQINIRILAAANRDLKHLVEKGAFREDLYYRINGIVLTIPPLRERGEDIIALANHFLRQHTTRAGREMRGISAGAMQLLATYPWPGNVRELEKVIEHAIVFGRSDFIIPEDLPQRLLGMVTPQNSPFDKSLTLVELERSHVLAALHEHGWNRTKAAKALGITRATLWRKLKVFRISDPD
ncbi:MAG: sigma-54-dependent Fis family transcriptional regulator [candidate division NC10 bacterium]|nr:sigma-54-dependent Fis family transcriptional regulator [candidate division NC10 bacterium]